jgi:hypothetical protein
MMHVQTPVVRPWGPTGARSLGRPTPPVSALRAALAVVALVALSGGLWGPGRAQAAVAGKTYDLWTSFGPGLSAPPVHTCVRFTATTIQVDACGPQAGPLLYETPLPVDPPNVATPWSGIVPCGGLDLVFNGGALDGLVLGFQANVFSAGAFSRVGRLAIGVEGVENPACR